MNFMICFISIVIEKVVVEVNRTSVVFVNSAEIETRKLAAALKGGH